MRLSRRRLLTIASVLMLLTTLAHTVGNLIPTSDPPQMALENTMRAFRFDAGMAMHPSMLDVHMTLVLTMSITFGALGVLNLILASARDLTDRLLARLLWTNIIWIGAFIGLCAFYRVPPPLISGVLIEIPLVAALLVK